jgi:hypothetical protein
MSSFLDRFVGRTQTISKLGPEQLFKGTEEALICTNTHKSFARSSGQHVRQQPKEEGERGEGESEEGFHLPQLQPRYLDLDFRRQQENQLHTHSRMRVDKETNWMVEEPLPTQPAPEERLIASVDPQKENHGRPRDKEERRLKSYHLHKSVSRLGGLGPNIGGQEWAARKEKQEKAMVKQSLHRNTLGS